MTNTVTSDVAATVAQIKRLEAAGCDIVRAAVPDEAAARAIAAIKREIGIPLVADIHFDYRLAVLAANAGADKIRINPGNIGGETNVRAVVSVCKKLGLPIRIGVNGGSLEKELLEKHGGVTPEAMVESALGHVRLLNDCGFDEICISVKSSDTLRTIVAYRLLSERCDYPLHIGVTEAGAEFAGTVRSAVGIGALLAEGIGDTIRVSLTADPIREVESGVEILKALGLRRGGARLISCPTCGRTKTDMIKIAGEVEKRLKTLDRDITVAVMGCAVNGPGEAREADYGVADTVLFAKGQIIKKVSEETLVEELFELIGND
jgi:(E)-4-hydroxy-3-methylbut-2-enyl-diphosphate synthase